MRTQRTSNAEAAVFLTICGIVFITYLAVNWIVS